MWRFDRIHRYLNRHAAPAPRRLDLAPRRPAMDRALRAGADPRAIPRPDVGTAAAVRAAYRGAHTKRRSGRSARSRYRERQWPAVGADHPRSLQSPTRNPSAPPPPLPPEQPPEQSAAAAARALHRPPQRSTNRHRARNAATAPESVETAPRARAVTGLELAAGGHGGHADSNDQADCRGQPDCGPRSVVDVFVRLTGHRSRTLAQ